jgi:hypothetical protein
MVVLNHRQPCFRCDQAAPRCLLHATCVARSSPCCRCKCAGWLCCAQTGVCVLRLVFCTTQQQHNQGYLSASYVENGSVLRLC